MSRDNVNGYRSRQHVVRVNSWRRCHNLASAVTKSLGKNNDFYRRMPFLEGKVLVYSSLVSVFLDTWYLYVPHKPYESGCLIMDKKLLVILVVLGSCLDVFASAILFRGSLFSVYMTRSAVSRAVGFLSILPLPQVSSFIVLAPWSRHRLHVLATIISGRILLLLLRTYISYRETVWLSGSFNTAAWAGAAFAATVCIVLCNVFGAVWYNFSLARIMECWRVSSLSYTNRDLTINCGTAFLGRIMNITAILDSCHGGNTFDFGIYADAIDSDIFSSPSFFRKVTFCLWWAIQNMSSFGQNLKTTTFFWDMLFVSAGVVCFSLLIVTMQAYLQPLVSMLPVKDQRKDLRRWKPFYSLPKGLRKQISCHRTANSWQETGEVNLENLLYNVTVDLRRKIKSHLCTRAFASVPVFKGLNERGANSLHDRLRPVLFSERTFIIQEGLPVFEIIFVVQGKLLIHRMLDGSNTTLASTKVLTEGDVCGEELLDHVVARGTCSQLPIAARTIQSVTKVEAFALTAWDLSYLASRYHGLLFPSELETHAARTIQEAWRRYWGKNAAA